MSKSKNGNRNAPCCVFCGRSRGVQFVIFNPRFQPFGTACVECETKLPEGTKLPTELLPVIKLAQSELETTAPCGPEQLLEAAGVPEKTKGKP
jgi:hypothetical protein